jgi:hypothetical protein
VVKCERNRDRLFKGDRVSRSPQEQKQRGGVVSTRDNHFPEQQGCATEQQGFTTEDILWALGIWSVILGLSPVIVFYMLMVA